MNIIPPELSALLAIKLLSIMLNDESLAYATPPVSPALLLVKVLFVKLNDESSVNTTPPR